MYFHFLLFLSGGVPQYASSESDSSRRLPGLIPIHHEIVSTAPSTRPGLLLICKLRQESRQHTGWVCHWSPRLLACRSHCYKLLQVTGGSGRVRQGSNSPGSLPCQLSSRFLCPWSKDVSCFAGSRSKECFPATSTAAFPCPFLLSMKVWLIHY